ncbi:hypothetical protein Tco_1289296 [Tanacetum coccineum]
MSDSDDSIVTYTAVSSPFGGLSDIGSPGVDGPPVMPEDPYAYVVAAFQAPSSSNYVPGLEEPEQEPLLSKFVPEPVYPEFMPLEDDVLPVEGQPLPAAVSPTTDSPGYVPEFDPDEDPEEDDEEEEEDHLASADSTVVALLAVNHAPSAKETELTPPAGTPPLLPIPLPTPSPPLLLPSTDHRAYVREVCLPPRKRLCFALGPRYEVGNSSSAPTTKPIGGFRVDYGFVATLDGEIRRDTERDVGYGITETWEEMLVDMPGAPATDETELGRRLTNFVTTVRQDTDEIYGRLDDAHDARSLLSGRLNMMYRDRRAHARTALLMEREARLSREA